MDDSKASTTISKTIASDQSQQRLSNRCRLQVSTHQGGTNQLSSFILFASLILLINLCPETDLSGFRPTERAHHIPHEEPHFRMQHATRPVPSAGVSQTFAKHQSESLQSLDNHAYLSYLQASLEFVKLVFTQPMRLQKRVTRSTLAEARVLGKMAKVWYIKKKIKKLSKKLKKHTIAVPVFTAIPIYEHSYYPQPHVTHVSHSGMHHAAASSYAPATIAQVAASSAVPMATSGASSQQQMATSASNQHHVAAYRMSPHHRSHTGNGGMYHPSAAAHHIINAYAPAPPLFVDDTGGLYGTYGNAYGRYDGGYHVW